MKKDFIEGVDYYLFNGNVVMTEIYHIKRGFCCGNGCKHCAYEPAHTKGNINVKEDLLDLKRSLGYISKN